MYPSAARVGCFAWPLLAALALAGCLPKVNDASPTPTGGDRGSGGSAGGGGAGGTAGAGGTGGAEAGGGTVTASGGARPTGGAGGLGGGPERDGSPGSGGTDAADAGAPDLGPTNPLVPNQTMACATPPLAVPTQHLEAECALAPDGASCSGVSGGQQGTQLQDGGTTVGYIEGGDALWFSGLRLDGVTTLGFRYAKGVDGGSLEVRLDGASGSLLGTFTPTSTGAWTTWSTATVAVTPTTGTHALYLVAAGSTGGICNLDWVELGGGNGAGEAPAVHLNHLGFDTLGPKHAVVEGAAGLDRFAIVGPDGTAYWCGDLASLSFADWGSSKSFYSVDFTGLTRPGSYRLQIGTALSGVFEIGDARLFATTFPAVLDYFKASRADDADVWAADESIPLVGTERRADVRGGWYDASGDISKYLTHLSYANFMSPQQIPLVAWALAWVYDRNPTALAASGRAAATREEALWGADYLLRVLDPVGYFYTNVFDHWSGNVGAREICAIVGEGGGATADFQSAMREGGGMSIAALARIARWQVGSDSFTSAQYLAGAELAFNYLNGSGGLYADDGKENVIDDYAALLAASELFATTRTSSYLAAARARATSLIGRLSAEGYFIADGGARPFWHASDAGLPVVALARYVELETDAQSADAARQAIQKHLDYLLRITRSPANPFGYARQHTAPGTVTFFMPHQNETQYWWQGENARLGSLAAAALVGAEALGTRGDAYLDLLRFAGWQVDWVLGANPYDVSFLRGFGKNNPPPYCASKSQAGTLTGGIANGITGLGDDGSGIRWPAASNGSCGDDWRAVEQWLPHAAWYMVAVTALAGR